MIKKKIRVALCAFLTAGLLSSSALRDPVNAACCYFAAQDKDINQPGQKAFISWNPDEKVEAFTVQPKFEGNAVDFGMVIPTPNKPKLDEMPRDFFKDLANYTILMPLPQMINSGLEMLPPGAVASFGFKGRGNTLGLIPEKRAVRIVESGVVGSLDYKIIVADEANALFDWLKANQYSFAGTSETLDFYIKKKSFFTVMKIDPKQMKTAADGSYTGEVTPTRFTFSTEQCFYPLKITQISVKDKTDALFYVQAPQQMDLPGDWSWMHSYRSMYLTYLVGCGATPEQHQELQTRNQWISQKRQHNPQYETTKLEWAKPLGEADMNVLEDPVKNFSQMGTGDLPPGASVIALDDFLKEVKAEYEKNHKEWSDFATASYKNMGDQYQPAKGIIVKYDKNSVGKGFIRGQYAWYPAREAPLDAVKGLTRLKGHLQKGQWLTKFRKVLRKDEMTDDMVMTAVPKDQEQSYVRIMPTSPP